MSLVPSPSSVMDTDAKALFRTCLQTTTETAFAHWLGISAEIRVSGERQRYCAATVIGAASDRVRALINLAGLAAHHMDEYPGSCAWQLQDWVTTFVVFHGPDERKLGDIHSDFSDFALAHAFFEANAGTLRCRALGEFMAILRPAQTLQ